MHCWYVTLWPFTCHHIGAAADDYAPPAQKASWFAAFYLCIPVGFAAGYIYGGLVAAAAGWRAAFLIEAGVMVPFVLFMFTTQPLHLHGMHDAGPGGRSAACLPILCVMLIVCMM